MNNYGLGITKIAILLLATIIIVGISILIALYDFGGEIGLLTKEEPRLAYLYCREEIKETLHLSNYTQFDKYNDAAIYTLDIHQYMVKIGVNVVSTLNLQVRTVYTCIVIARQDATWLITNLFKR
jgi:hypothetical protein